MTVCSAVKVAVKLQALLYDTRSSASLIPSTLLFKSSWILSNRFPSIRIFWSVTFATANRMHSFASSDRPSPEGGANPEEGRVIIPKSLARDLQTTSDAIPLNGWRTQAKYPPWERMAHDAGRADLKMSCRDLTALAQSTMNGRSEAIRGAKAFWGGTGGHTYVHNRSLVSCSYLRLDRAPEYCPKPFWSVWWHLYQRG